jgi:methyl-accepting chemotaxis protein
MNLRSLGIARRSVLGFGVIATVVAVLGLFGLYQMSGIRAESEQIEQESIPGIISSDNLALQLTRIRAEALRLVAVPANVSTTQETIKRLSQGVDAEFAKYQPRVTSDDERNNFDQLLTIYRDYLIQADQLALLVKQEKVDQARELIMSTMAKSGAKMNELSARLQADNVASASLGIVAVSLPGTLNLILQGRINYTVRTSHLSRLPDFRWADLFFGAQG